MIFSVLFRCPPNAPNNNKLAATTATSISTESTTFSMTTPLKTLPATISSQFSTFNNLKLIESAIPSAIATSTPVATSFSVSHIPIYQYNNYFSQSNSARIQANDVHCSNINLLAAAGATAVASDNFHNEKIAFRKKQHEPISNQCRLDALTQTTIHPPISSMTSVAQTQTINQPERMFGQSASPPLIYQRQPFPMNQNQLHREQLSELLRHTSADVAYTSTISNYEPNRLRSIPPPTQSFPEQNMQTISSPNRLQHLQHYSNATSTTIDRHDGAMYGDTRLDNLNKFYKTTLTLQGQHPNNDEFDEPTGKVLLKRDAVYNKLGNWNLSKQNSFSKIMSFNFNYMSQFVFRFISRSRNTTSK